MQTRARCALHIRLALLPLFTVAFAQRASLCDMAAAATAAASAWLAKYNQA